MWYWNYSLVEENISAYMPHYIRHLCCNILLHMWIISLSYSQSHDNHKLHYFTHFWSTLFWQLHLGQRSFKWKFHQVQVKNQKCSIAGHMHSQSSSILQQYPSSIPLLILYYLKISCKKVVLLKVLPTFALLFDYYF